MKLIYVFDGLQFGGIERVGVEYIKLLTLKGYNIDVINLKPKLVDLEKELPRNVKVIHIHYPRSISPYRYSKLKRINTFFRVSYSLVYIVFSALNRCYDLYCKFKIRNISNADAAIAFSGHFNDLTFVADNLKKKSKKTVAWLHGSQYSYEILSPGYFELYKKISNLVCLSENDDEKIKQFNLNHNIRKVKIYNPLNLKGREIDNNKISELKNQYHDYILMVGRLAKDKDQATLIRSLQILYVKYSLKKNLLLVGDGPERNNLIKLSNKLGIGEFVHFTGARYDVQNYYSAATIYAHSSPAEGLPTVLLEAMYYHLPIASTNSEPGVSEILQNKYGLISPVGDAEALANNIYKLYSNKSLCNKLVDEETVRIDDFMPDRVITQFEKFIED